MNIACMLDHKIIISMNNPYIRSQNIYINEQSIHNIYINEESAQNIYINEQSIH